VFCLIHILSAGFKYTPLHVSKVHSEGVRTYSDFAVLALLYCSSMPPRQVANGVYPPGVMP